MANQANACHIHFCKDQDNHTAKAVMQPEEDASQTYSDPNTAFAIAIFFFIENLFSKALNRSTSKISHFQPTATITRKRRLCENIQIQSKLGV